jgi:hypothetical protein
MPVPKSAIGKGKLNFYALLHAVSTNFRAISTTFVAFTTFSCQKSLIVLVCMMMEFTVSRDCTNENIK